LLLTTECKGGANYTKEWMIFAICLGLGGHIALALLLHVPEPWPAETLWLNGVILALAVYLGVQLLRSVWWLCRGRRSEGGLR